MVMQSAENHRKSVRRTQAAKEATRKSLLNYSKVYYIELIDKGSRDFQESSILGPQGFKTWIQCYRFLSNFFKGHGVNIKEIPKLKPNTWSYGTFQVEIKWMKVI